MKLVLALIVAFVSVVEAVDRDKLLDVMATVHSNHKLLTTYDDEAHERREHKCYGHFMNDTNAVCGSNGQTCVNLSIFNYRKCMLKFQLGTELKVMDMEFCKRRDIEDMKLSSKQLEELKEVEASFNATQKVGNSLSP